MNGAQPPWDLFNGVGEMRGFIGKCGHGESHAYCELMSRVMNGCMLYFPSAHGGQ